MSHRVVLITGSSTGIGFSTAILLAQDPEKRFKVYATVRNIAKGRTLEEAGKEMLGISLFIKGLDVCSDDSVNQTVQEILDTEGRVDILINNAGVGLFGILETQTMEIAKSVFETNVFGLLRVTKLVLPKMKANKSGHIINISCMGGINSVPFSGVYCATKFAVEGLTESLAPLAMKFNVKCSLIEPGPVGTSFVANQKDYVKSMQSSTAAIDDETKQLLANATERMKAQFVTMVQTPNEVAEVIREALLSDKPHLRYQTNKMYASTVKAKLVDPTGDRSAELIHQRFFH